MVAHSVHGRGDGLARRCRMFVEMVSAKIAVVVVAVVEKDSVMVESMVMLTMSSIWHWCHWRVYLQEINQDESQKQCDTFVSIDYSTWKKK